MTHERRAGYEERTGDRPPPEQDEVVDLRDEVLDVTDDPDELAPNLPPQFVPLPTETRR